MFIELSKTVEKWLRDWINYQNLPLTNHHFANVCALILLPYFLGLEKYLQYRLPESNEIERKWIKTFGITINQMMLERNINEARLQSK